MLQDAVIKRCIGSVLLCLSFSLFAAKDPVGWSLIPASGFPSTEVGQHSSVVYTLTNNIPYDVTLHTESRSAGGTFQVYDQCKNVRLAYKQSCIVSVDFTPSQAGLATYQLVYSYDYNVIPLPILTINATGHTNTDDVVGYITDFPSLITLTPLEQPHFTVTYVNHSSASVTGYAGNASDANIFQISPSIASAAVVSPSNTNNTCGIGSGSLPLASKGHCFVNGQITPTSPGKFTLTALYTYNSGAKTVTPTAQALIQQNGHACGLTPSVVLPLPTETYPYADNVVKFKFSNQCASTSVALGPVTVATGAGSVPATITQSQSKVVYDSCSNQTLTGSGFCYVLASVVPNTTATGALSVLASVSNGYNTYEAHTNSKVVANSISGQPHQVHFINQCSFNVWYGIENGATGTVISADPTIGAGTAGNDNAYFLAAAVPGQAPKPSSDGGIRNLAVSSYENGSLWGRTGCAYSGDQFACQTGMCNTLANSATCVKSNSTLSVTPQNPFTKLEFTIVSTPGGDGVYDVSMLNAFNVSAEIKALGPFVSGSPSLCTGAGAPLQQPNNQLGSCSWQLDPRQSPSSLSRPDFLLVTPGANSDCVNDESCSGIPGQACGMGFRQVNSDTSNNTPPINRLCGDFLGFSNLENYQPYNSDSNWGSTTYNLFTNYKLGTPLTDLGYSTYGDFLGLPATFGDMIACKITSTNSLNTCYPNPGVITNPDEYNFANCCGCVDWSLAGLTYNGGHTCPITIPSYPKPAVNTAWTDTAGTPVSAENAIYWQKLACPTAYSYAFDDPSSSFTCTKDAAGKNLNTDYDVVFCPGGLSGLPAGINEGR